MAEKASVSVAPISCRLLFFADGKLSGGEEKGGFSTAISMCSNNLKGVNYSSNQWSFIQIIPDLEDTQTTTAAFTSYIHKYMHIHTDRSPTGSPRATGHKEQEEGRGAGVGGSHTEVDH